MSPHTPGLNAWFLDNGVKSSKRKEIGPSWRKATNRNKGVDPLRVSCAQPSLFLASRQAWGKLLPLPHAPATMMTFLIPGSESVDRRTVH